MTIKCDSIQELVAICAQLVREGLTFEADAGRLKITLTGGY